MHGNGLKVRPLFPYYIGVHFQHKMRVLKWLMELQWYLSGQCDLLLPFLNYTFKAWCLVTFCYCSEVTTIIFSIKWIFFVQGRETHIDTRYIVCMGNQHFIQVELRPHPKKHSKRRLHVHMCNCYNPKDSGFKSWYLMLLKTTEEIGPHLRTCGTCVRQPWALSILSGVIRGCLYWRQGTKVGMIQSLLGVKCTGPSLYPVCHTNSVFPTMPLVTCNHSSPWGTPLGLHYLLCWFSQLLWDLSFHNVPFLLSQNTVREDMAL